ncbi:hypothetical protein WJX84_006134 [Apatococcus fuscideae]|uniref:ABC transporter domain-containing protein n=1 Tax=Apatococcus fuscideae TaxID=2026836 RepID=A0AAW1SRB4_9CHLO
MLQSPASCSPRCLREVADSRQHVPVHCHCRQSPQQLRGKHNLGVTLCPAPRPIQTLIVAAGKKGKGKGPDEEGRVTTTSVSSGIKLENVAITFSMQQVLKNVTWDVKTGERVGLVGVNGAGKTTQLQIITGELEPDTGDVIKARPSMRIAYLTQEFDVNPGRTVREEFLSAYDEQIKVQNRLEEVQVELENVGSDMDKMTPLLDEMEKLNNKAVDLDMSLLDSQVDKMMPELGFTPEDNDRLVASFSGGWQMRMCLGKILLQEPDLLLLDEPTNHLDLQAIEWLEGYLKSQEIPMVIVSHDREFLDQLCTKIVETDAGVSTTYKGNYTEFVAAKKEAIAQQYIAYEKQQKEINRLEEMISRLAAGTRGGRAASAKIELERLKAPGSLVEKPFEAKRRTFSFPPVERMGQEVLSIKGLTHGYRDRLLFKDATCTIEKGERVAIIGGNGAGKSTLLRLIMGEEKPVEGEVTLGEHMIKPNYYEQNQSEALDPSLTVLKTLELAAPDAELQDIKAILGRMMFSGSAMDKKAEVLSGGERARLALAKFMMTKGTLLVLDEPTNHLDIPSKEMLEEACKNFQGALIAASHDRYFLRQVATRVLEVDKGRFRDYPGATTTS